MLDLKNPLPLYVQLREILRREIEEGKWEVGDQIPGEQDLVNQYGVARATVRQAIMDLVNEGLLFRKQGRGTFVCRTRRLDTIEPLVSFSAEMTSRGITPGSQLLEKGTPPSMPQQVTDLMGPDTRIFYLARLRTADGVPMAIEYSYFNEETVPDLEREDLEGSLYQLLAHRRQMQVKRVAQSIGTDLADAEQAKILHISPGSPVLTLERTMYTTGDQPFYWLKFVFRGDVYRINTVLEEDRI
ncbi:MAG: GntR family transcriptional regulator [Candidatus Saccharibacteria bacterium]